MKYILDNNGYVESASCNPISCGDKVSQEYTGTIPNGYETLDEWILKANIRAYKVVSGNLVYDEAKDAELAAEVSKYEDNLTAVCLFEGDSSADITLNDEISNYKYLEILYGNSTKTLSNSVKVSTQCSGVALSVMATAGIHLYINTTELIFNINKLTIGRCGINDLKNGATSIVSSSTTSPINIYKVFGYK